MAGSSGWGLQGATTSVISAGLSLVSRSPDKAGRAFASALSKVAKSGQQKMVADWVKWYLEPGNPGQQFMRNLARLDPNVRKKSLAGFISSAFFRDPEVSERLKREHGINAPNLIAISPSMRCNIRCKGCFTGAYDKKDDLPEELVDRILTEAEEIGTNVFILIGGEPFMWEPMFRMVEKHSDSVFLVFTNATWITPEHAKRIAQLGNFIPQVSIEGVGDFTDRRRGEGVFAKAARGMENLRDAGVLFAFSTTATRWNLDHITSDEYIDTMIELGCSYGWFFSYAPIGRDPDLSFMPTPEERDRLRRETHRIRTTKPILVADFWNDGALTGGCLSAGRKYLHINNKGDVEPCVFFHFAVDNIKDKSLIECLTSDYFRDLRRLQPFGHNLLRPCPLIDHPGVSKKIVEKHNAYATHDGAESLFTELRPGLLEYSTCVNDIYAPVWQEEYRWTEEWLRKDEEWHRRRDKGEDADTEVEKIAEESVKA